MQKRKGERKGEELQKRGFKVPALDLGTT